MGFFSNANNTPSNAAPQTPADGGKMEAGNDGASGGVPPSPEASGKPDGGINIPGKWRQGGRGRPPKYASVAGGSEAGKPSAPRRSSSAAVPAIDPTYFVETVIQLAKCGDDIWRNYLLREIRVRLPEKESELGEILAKTALNATDEKTLRSILPILVAKYDFLSRMGPEVCLLIWLAQYSIRMVSVQKFVTSFPKQAVEKDVTPPDKKPEAS